MDKSPNEPRSMSKVPTYMFLVTIRIIFLIIRFSQQKKKKKRVTSSNSDYPRIFKSRKGIGVTDR